MEFKVKDNEVELGLEEGKEDEEELGVDGGDEGDEDDEDDDLKVE